MNKYTLTEANLNDLISWLRGGHVNRVAAALENLKPTAEAVQVEPVAQGCDFTPGLPFLIHKDDEFDKHSAWYVVLPTTPTRGSGCLISFNHCADDAVDKARATFVANACNAYAGISNGVAWQNFPSYLIDHCEGDVITEEGLQFALAKMLKDPLYATPQEAAVNAWVAVSERLPESDQGWIVVRWDDDTEENVCGRYSLFEANEGFNSQFATHWMPLPEAPREAS